MKNLVATLVLTLGILTTTFAQRGEKDDFEKFTPEQRTELHLKKMILKLDLTPSQASQIKPLLIEKENEHRQMREHRKSIKKKGQKPSKDERFKMMSNHLDRQIEFKEKMKRILNEKQYEKFEKIADKKMHKMKKKLHKRKGKKRRNDFLGEER